MSVLNKIVQGATKLVSKFTGLSQEESARNAAEKTVTPGMPELLRRAAAEGAVLLKMKMQRFRSQTAQLFLCSAEGRPSGSIPATARAVMSISRMQFLFWRDCGIVRPCRSTSPLPPYIQLGARKIRLTTAFGGIGRAITRICR